jgi:hypothetical protein
MGKEARMADDLAGMSEEQLLDAAVSVLTSRLPSDWAIEKTKMGGDDEARDLLIKAPFGNPQAAVLVELRREFAPRDVQTLMGGLMRRLRKQTGEMPILLVAPYLSPQTRESLAEEGISFVDLTGNIRIALRQPAMFVEIPGAQRDPSTPGRSRGIRGAKAGAVVRVLIDARPPYTGAEIARAANVNEGYTSRILDSLQDEGLIERRRPGPVTEADWPALIRRRARALDLFKPIGTDRFVARSGTRQVLEALRGMDNERSFVITGSFAAERIAPVTAPATLVLYAMEPRRIAAELDLLEVDTGADTVLVRPDNYVVFDRATREDGLLWAAPSQVAIDCLAGGGRMPAEGEALIEWMRANEDRWRYPTIGDLIEATGSADE